MKARSREGLGEWVMKKKVEGKTIVFHQNPFYDDVFGTIVGGIIPSKNVAFSQDGQPKMSKSSRSFEDQMKEWLTNDSKPEWPRAGRLLVVVQIQMPKREYNTKDVDNMAKALLDALKGVVYTDDSQVETLQITKSIAENPSFMIGIRELHESDGGGAFPPLLKEGKTWNNVQYYKLTAR